MQVAITSPSTASLLTIARKTVTSTQEILAKHDATIAAAIPEPKLSSPSYRKASLSRHSVRLHSGQARSVTMLTEQLQAAAAAMNAGNAIMTSVSSLTTPMSPAGAISGTSTATSAATSAATVTSIATADIPSPHRPTLASIPEPPQVSPTISESPATLLTITESPETSPTVPESLETSSTVPESPETSSTVPESPEISPTIPESPETSPTIPESPKASPTVHESTQMSPTFHESTQTSPTIPVPLQMLPTIPAPLASSIRQAGFSSLKPVPRSPVIYSPLLRSTSNGPVPPKPLRRPPPSPPSMIMETNESFALDNDLQTIHSVQSSPSEPSSLLDSPSGPRDSLDNDSLPQPKPPLPPKPAHLHRKISELRNTGDLYLDDDDTDDDGSESDVVQGSARSPSHQTLLRKSSSPSIAIPNPKRRLGPSASVPVSPTHSPTNIPSSSPSSHDNRSFTQIRYSLLRQSSVGTLMTVIPEGCVDPTNLVEAERVNKEDEDQLTQKTYGPSDHIPMIPLSPLRTTHRSLVEKEKSWSAMLADTKQKLQAMATHTRLQDDVDESLSLEEQQCQQERRQEDENLTQLVLEDLHKCNLQIGNIMSTITKVRELLYRSASTTSILEFQPHLIAYQLTLVESAIFLEIPSSAFLTHSAKTPHRSITASTDFFNYLTRMIEYSILFPPEASGRAQCMNHWIKVAVKLHELENFQTLKAVLCALGTPPIKRLKRTWSFLPRKSANKLETLSELMSEARNYGRYREMMNSLCAGTICSTPTGEVTSPAFSDSSSVSSSSVSGSRFDILGSWTSSDIKAKEAARRPMVPFIGTFIMDMTYLLAAVKKSSFQGVPSRSAQVPATSSLHESSAPASDSSNSSTPQFCPQDDPRVQDLLLTLSAYQAGPKYSPQPPKAYIKASLKGQHHFRAPSLSSALQMTTKYRNSDRDRQSFDEDDDESLGGGSGGQSGFGGGIRSAQQLILHYLLTRPWVPERMVDELSTIREPSKVNKNASSSSTSSTSSTSSGTSISSWSSLSTGSSLYSQSTATSSSLPSGMDLRIMTSRGSFEGSRPTSVEEE
ncbi:hypothetical protein EC991_009847 [Linnemannia zychae]|nr:hypothetical protein EC991_009847 [Linnemannia zychae]